MLESIQYYGMPRGQNQCGCVSVKRPIKSDTLLSISKKLNLNSSFYLKCTKFQIVEDK